MTNAELVQELRKFPDNARVVMVDELGQHLNILEVVHWLNVNEITIRPVRKPT